MLVSRSQEDYSHLQAQHRWPATCLLMELDKHNRLASQSFLGSNSPEILARARIAIIGLGGGGSHIALQLAHVGIGNLVVVDYDQVEERNLNRMVGATARDARFGTLKTAVIRRVIKRVNPQGSVLAVSRKWQEEAEVLRDCDVIFGCVDTFSE